MKFAKGNYGGTMRLGAYPCTLRSGTIALQRVRGRGGQ